ncbi:hypothetical protein ACFX13_007160 [Malus domestica]
MMYTKSPCLASGITTCLLDLSSGAVSGNCRAMLGSLLLGPGSPPLGPTCCFKSDRGRWHGWRWWQLLGGTRLPSHGCRGRVAWIQGGPHEGVEAEAERQEVAGGVGLEDLEGHADLFSRLLRGLARHGVVDDGLDLDRRWGRGQRCHLAEAGDGQRRADQWNQSHGEKTQVSRKILFSLFSADWMGVIVTDK